MAWDKGVHIVLVWLHRGYRMDKMILGIPLTCMDPCQRVVISSGIYPTEFDLCLSISSHQSYSLVREWNYGLHHPMTDLP